MKKLFAICLVALSALISVHLQAQEVETLVLIDTDMGKIKVKLFNDTPQHRDNFIKLVKDGVYEGTLFHRVIKDFMIQLVTRTQRMHRKENAGYGRCRLYCSR